MSNESFNVPLNHLRNSLARDMKLAEEYQQETEKLKTKIISNENIISGINERIDSYQKAIRLLEGAFDQKTKKAAE